MTTAVLPRFAADVLRDCSLPFLRHLTVTENEQEIVLSGKVSTYYYKQLAQEAVMPVLGERRLKNMIVVN